jgi:hypothetical protein
MTKKKALAGEPDTAPLDAPAPALIDYSVEDGPYALLTTETGQMLVTYDLDFTAYGRVVVAVGRDVQQAGFGGFADKAGYVCVGPCHPVYVALNLAYQAGERAVEISGVDADLQALLSPWLAKVADLMAVDFT